MSLSISTKTEPSSQETKDTLEQYLSGAVTFISQARDSDEAGSLAREFAGRTDDEVRECYGKPDVSKISEADIKAKEKDLKTQSKDFSTKIKLDYALDGSEKRKDIKDNCVVMSDLATISAAFISASPVLVSASESQDTTTILASAGIACAIGAVAATSMISKRKILNALAPKSESEELSSKQYKEIKHSLLALKALKRELKKPEKEADKQMVNECFARGIGNPSGMITSFALKKDNQR